VNFRCQNLFPVTSSTATVNYHFSTCRRATLLAGCLLAGFLLIQLLAAETGVLGRLGSAALLLAGGAFLIATAVDLACTLGNSSASPIPRIFGLFLVSTVATALTLHSAKWIHSTECILGDNDEGTYATSAVNLAQTGGYFFHASLLPGLPPKFQPWVLKHEPAMSNRTAKPPARFLCYRPSLFVADQERGLAASQFPPEFPVLLGSAYSLFGYNGLRAVNLLLVIGAAGLAGLLGAKWLGRAAGAAACVLMLWFPLQIWIGNTLYSEPLAQLLWLLALLGWAERAKSPLIAGLLAGSSAGLGLAVKIDALPVAMLTAFAVLVQWKHYPRFSLALAAALAASGAASLGSWWLYDRPYVESTLRALAETNRAPLIAAAILGAIILLAAPILTRNKRVKSCLIQHGPAMRRWLLAAGLLFGLGLAGYAYLIRSHPAKPDTFYYWPAEHDIRSYREDTFLRLGWYWQPWGLAVAVLGLGVLLTRARELWQWLFLGLGLLFLISFCYDIRNNPIQPYGMRRFLPYAVPLMALGAAGLWFWLKNETLRAGLTVLTCAALAAGFFPTNQRLNTAGEFPGLIVQMESLAERVPAGAVVLVPDTSLLATLATPFEFAFGKPCLVIRGNMPSIQYEQATRSAIHGWQAAGRRVLVLAPRPGETLHLFQVQPQLLAQGRIETRATPQSANSLVLSQITWTLPWTLSELPPIAAPTPHPPQRAP
jgi:hypothetical protein